MDQEINITKYDTKNLCPNRWSIFLDGQDISKFNLASLRDQISIVDQNTTLFDDTVLNNIKYARPEASNEEVFKAAEHSMCAEFIRQFREWL